MRVLWLDNDLAYIEAYIQALRRTAHIVTPVKTLTALEAELSKPSIDDHYDLLILDMMVPTRNESEEAAYPPASTERGMVTGLTVLRKWLPQLTERGTKVLVFTVRLDRTVRELCTAAGLQAEAFATKMELNDTDAFLTRIDRLCVN